MDHLSQIPGLSRLGLGTGMLASLRGGLSSGGATKLVELALDSGARLIDTADSYAAGECEHLLGDILRGQRDKVTIMTKAGYVSADLPGPLRQLNPFLKKLKHKLGSRQDFRPGYIGRSLRRSLQRLKTDRVDVFVLHNPPADVLKDGRLFGELSELKAAGLALQIGISSGDDDALRLALAWADCTLIQTPLIEDGGLAAALKETGAGRPRIVLNHVSLGGRLPGPGSDASPSITAWQEKVSRRAAELGVGPHAALLRVALEETGADSVLTGTRSVSHMAENCRAVLS